MRNLPLTLSAPEIERLRQLARVARALSQATASDDEHLREVARQLCQEARPNGYRVEQILIALKQAWPIIVDAEGIPRSDGVGLLNRIVTVCVEEYYSPLG